MVEPVAENIWISKRIIWYDHFHWLIHLLPFMYISVQVFLAYSIDKNVITVTLTFDLYQLKFNHFIFEFNICAEFEGIPSGCSRDIAVTLKRKKEFLGWRSLLILHTHILLCEHCKYLLHICGKSPFWCWYQIPQLIFNNIQLFFLTLNLHHWRIVVINNIKMLIIFMKVQGARQPIQYVCTKPSVKSDVSSSAITLPKFFFTQAPVSCQNNRSFLLGSLKGFFQLIQIRSPQRILFLAANFKSKTLAVTLQATYCILTSKVNTPALSTLHSKIVFWKVGFPITTLDIT